MPFEVAEVECVLAHPRERVWELLSWPQWYPRFFAGVGDCRPHVTGGFRMIVGDSADTLTQLRFEVTERIAPESLTLETESAAIARVRLLLAPDNQTRVLLTLFRPALVHPAGAARKSAVVRWALAGLTRVDDYLSGAPSSVVARQVSPWWGPAQLSAHVLAARALPSPWPWRSWRQFRALRQWGYTLPGGYIVGAQGSPSQTAVLDDLERRSYGQLDQRITRLAGALAAIGIGPDRPVGLLARNHCGFIETAAACGMLGTDVVLINTGLSAGQLTEITTCQDFAALILDAEFLPLAAQVPPDVPRLLSSGRAQDLVRITDLIATGEPRTARPPRKGQVVLLTSGTAGIPKPVVPPHPRGLRTMASLVERMPLRAGEVIHIAVPLFHIWGLDWLYLGAAPRSTVVLAQRFDPADCLRLIARRRVTVLVAAPIMLRRIMDLPREVRARFDTSSLRMVACGGAPLAANLAREFMDAFGDVLYNFYGSTELSWATIARPADLRAAPDTAGQIPLGVRLEILDGSGRVVPRGAVGRVFAGNSLLFPGLLDGKPPSRVRGLLDSGDLGYLDAHGRLCLVGRGDDMVISGGENVFPQAVEAVLGALPQVVEVAVVGVTDREFGQRLAAYLVCAPGKPLDPVVVRNYVRERLTRFHVPRDVVYVAELPRTATGKVLKRVLLEHSAQLSA